MTDTITTDQGRSPDEGQTPVAHLMVALPAGDPLGTPSRHRLAGIDQVALGRADGREVQRAGGVLTVALADAWLSSQHARMRRVLHRWAVEDLGSRNGTFVNGARVREIMLEDGDVIEIGHTFLLFRQVPPDGGPADLDVEALASKPPGLATLSPGLARQIDQLERVARSDQPVLIGGQSGTGKELMARALHTLSGRGGDFVAVNCGSLPEALAEAELFGHRRGAFSGAVAERTGYVRSADGGTLLLDEIADLRPPSQAALLRVLQERQVTPIGAERPVPVDVRFCAATHRTLSELVASGDFREDLYARLRGFELQLSPLRQRREDLGLVLGALLRRRGQAATFKVGALRALFAHSWPHNVRELEQVLGVALALARDQPIDREHLPPALTRTPEPAGTAGSDRRPLREPELAHRAELVRLLREHQGNIAAVSRATGKGRQQVHRWLKRYALDPESFRR
jgi:DNA-binding NtrC family response regulator